MGQERGPRKAHVSLFKKRKAEGTLGERPPAGGPEMGRVPAIPGLLGLCQRETIIGLGWKLLEGWRRGSHSPYI